MREKWNWKHLANTGEGVSAFITSFRRIIWSQNENKSLHLLSELILSSIDLIKNNARISRFSHFENQIDKFLKHVLNWGRFVDAKEFYLFDITLLRSFRDKPKWTRLKAVPRNAFNEKKRLAENRKRFVTNCFACQTFQHRSSRFLFSLSRYSFLNGCVSWWS